MKPMPVPSRLCAVLVVVGIALAGAGSTAQQAPRGGGGGGGRGGAPIPFDNYTGFEKIFNGTTLANWDGDPTFWRAEGGSIVGESTAEKPVTENTFLIYRGSEPDNFELKLEFKMNSTNSGVQYRSRQLTGAVGKWVLCGYQADIDFDNNYTGMLYEERGRPGFLAPRGTVQYAGPNPTQQGQCSSGLPVAPRGQGAAPRGQGGAAPAAAAPATVRGQIGELESGESLKAFIKVNDWNQFQVIARGNTLIHILNGHTTAIFIDDDQTNRAMKGLIGLQIHVGPPMKIEFRNVYLKNLR